jgi:hypothetical protein
MTTTSNLDDICLSGGAEGADLQWGMCAGMIGHMVVHFSFSGHRSAAPEAELVVLTPEQLEAADGPCKAASKGIKRWFPPKSLFVKNLLRRNWYQVKDAERVYAVASFEDGIVTGGTSWAVQMFIDRFDGEACEAYVFDQITGAWFMWAGEDGWLAVTDVPKPHGVWAGIGSRKLLPNGKQAIRTLLGYVSNASLI